MLPRSNIKYQTYTNAGNDPAKRQKHIIMNTISTFQAALAAADSSSRTPARPVPEELLSPIQLALRLGISRRTLANWTREALLPMIKIGRVCRFEYSKVRAALDQYERQAVTKGAGTSSNSIPAAVAPPPAPAVSSPATPAPSAPVVPDTPPVKPAVSDFSKAVLTAAQLASMPRKQLAQGPRRPVWRHHYDPYAGPPVAQTVKEALARAAKAPPGTIPEVEMLTPEEIDQRMEEIRNRPAPTPSLRKAARRKR